MIEKLHVSFRPGFSIQEDDIKATIELASEKMRLRLSNLSQGLKATRRLLASPAASEAELYGVAERNDQSFSSGRRLLYYLLELQEIGLTEYSLKSGAKLRATVECFEYPVAPSRVMSLSRREFS